jgi:hypothetical protein
MSDETPLSDADLEALQKELIATVDEMEGLAAKARAIGQRITDELRRRDAAKIREFRPRPAGHAFVRPGQVAADLPAPDACVRCGRPEAGHGDGGE